MGLFDWLGTSPNPVFPKARQDWETTTVVPNYPPSGGPTEPKPDTELTEKIYQLEKSIGALEEKANGEKVAAYNITTMMFGPEDNMIGGEYFLIKNLEIFGDSQSLRFRSLVHNKRTTNKDTQTSMSVVSDYPPMLEDENLIDYIDRVAKLPYMEWNDFHFDETVSICYRGRTIYTFDEKTGKSTYIRGDKLSVKEVKEDEKSSVVAFKPNKDN